MFCVFICFKIFVKILKKIMIKDLVSLNVFFSVVTPDLRRLFYISNFIFNAF